MWWRWIIAGVVSVSLFWFYYRPASTAADRLEASEQAVHFFLGMILPLLLSPFFVFGPHYAAIALFLGVAKEAIEFLIRGDFAAGDSCTDVSFWFLGGLTAPLIKSF